MTTERRTGESHDAPLQVDLLGANQRLRDTLAMVMHGPAKARCALADGGAARAVIVNLDGVGAESEWAHYRERHPERPALVLTLDAAVIEHATATVMKPVRIDAFLAALDVIDAALGSGAAQARNAIPAPASAPVSANANTVPASSLPGGAPCGLTSRAPGADHRNTVHDVVPFNVTAPPAPHPLPSMAHSSNADAPTLVNEDAHTDPITEVLDSTATSLRLSSVTDAWRAVCGDAPDCDLDDPEQTAQRRCLQGTDMLDCLVGALATAHRERCDVAVRLHDAPLVVLDIREQRARLSVSMQQLEALCGVTMNTGALTAIPSSVAPADPSAGPRAATHVPSRADSHAAQAAHLDAAPGAADAVETPCALSIEALLWQVALWTFRGLLPAAAPLDHRVYLAYWPNLTRLAPIPNACRIAALLVRHPMQLARVAEALAIPQRHVFAFYGAAHAIGLMGTARREVDHLVQQTPPEADSRRALLARLATRIARDGRRADAPR